MWPLESCTLSMILFISKIMLIFNTLKNQRYLNMPLSHISVSEVILLGIHHEARRTQRNMGRGERQSRLRYWWWQFREQEPRMRKCKEFHQTSWGPMKSLGEVQMLCGTQGSLFRMTSLPLWLLSFRDTPEYSVVLLHSACVYIWGCMWGIGLSADTREEWLLLLTHCTTAFIPVSKSL